MLFHFGQCILLLHAALDSSVIVEHVAYRGRDSKVGKGWYSNWTEKLFPILLTAGSGSEVQLRVLRARCRQRKFLGLGEGSHRCCQSTVVIQGLCDDLIDGLGMEQRPPISLDLPAEVDVLHGAAHAGIFGAQSIVRISRCRWGVRSREVGAHGAPT